MQTTQNMCFAINSNQLKHTRHEKHFPHHHRSRYHRYRICIVHIEPRHGLQFSFEKQRNVHDFRRWMRVVEEVVGMTKTAHEKKEVTDTRATKHCGSSVLREKVYHSYLHQTACEVNGKTNAIDSKVERQVVTE